MGSVSCLVNCNLLEAAGFGGKYRSWRLVDQQAGFPLFQGIEHYEIFYNDMCNPMK